MNKISIIILLFLLVFTLQSFGQSKKELLQENQSLIVATDSLRRSLAEARREWQKCKDFSSSNQEVLVKKTETDQSQIDALKAKLASTQKRLSQVTDTLRFTKEACELLQTDMAKVSQIEFALATKAEKLQNELNDSLSSWIGPHVSLLRHKDKVSLTLSDSILFGGGSFINGTGQRLFIELVKVIKSYDDIKLVVNGWGAHTTIPKDALAEGLRRALSVAILLDIYKWPADRVIAVGQGLWQGKEGQYKSPIRIDFLPQDDSRF